eukprot:GEMP01065866.1.p1 GENE.GEMP01065866.1~~GEMP01065866.1.p1  ORF type:complete len:229 (+),score=48.89 GEMP01065866.1:39-725(+)
MKLNLLVGLFGLCAAETNAEGKAFLEKKAAEEGVVTLPSGLLYKVLQKGKGMYHPRPSAKCDCHYEGTLIDGTEFDSSYKRGQPLELSPNGVIAGWKEAMQLMVEGDKWELYIPSDLAYGDNGSPPSIPGESALVFIMELLEIKGKKVRAKGTECDYNTGINCSDEEKQVHEEFKKEWMPTKDAWFKLKEKSKETLKTQERKKVDGRRHLLRAYLDWMKKQPKESPEL